MANKPLVSIVIPTKNSARFLDACLASIAKQSYAPVETIVVDGQSTDGTIELADKWGVKVVQYDPKVKAGFFDAPFRRNYGVEKAKGKFVYYVDADMELSESVVQEAVERCMSENYDAVIIPEDSFGDGVWAQAKNLERRCYWGDDTVEAPRFVRRDVWLKLGGLDSSLGGGGDDWDFYEKLRENGYRVARVKSLVMHNEGNLSLKRLMRKRFMYGRDSIRYISKRPTTGVKSYFPIRMAYIRNWRLFVDRPGDSCAFVVMRVAEYGAGASGIIYSFLQGKS